MKTKTLKSTAILLAVIFGLSMMVAFFTAAGQAVQRKKVKEMFAENWCLNYNVLLDGGQCTMVAWPGFDTAPKDELIRCGQCTKAGGGTCSANSDCKDVCGLAYVRAGTSS